PEIWSADPKNQPTRRYGPGGSPWGTDIHPDGDLIAMGTAEGALQILSRESGELKLDESGHGMVWTAQFSPDGRYLISSSRRNGSAAILWTSEGEELCELRTPGDVRSVAFNKQGSLVATGSFDGWARIYTVPNGRLVGSFEHPRIVEDMVFGAEENLLITGCSDGLVRFWCLDKEEERYPPLIHKDAVLAVDLSPDGTILATGGRDRTARMWDTASRSPVGAILEHSDWVEDLDFSPDGALLLTGCADRRTRLWSVASCERVGPPYLHDRAVRTVLFDHDGRQFMTAAHPPGPEFWDVPEPVSLPGDQLDLWVQARTGRHMDEHGVLALLSPKEWQEVREKLKLDGDQHLE
ncbi:MAG: WD40 repeat domain-containing protein, partial [Verrucomicrobiales bacterium]